MHVRFLFVFVFNLHARKSLIVCINVCVCVLLSIQVFLFFFSSILPSFSLIVCVQRTFYNLNLNLPKLSGCINAHYVCVVHVCGKGRHLYVWMYIYSYVNITVEARFLLTFPLQLKKEIHCDVDIRLSQVSVREAKQNNLATSEPVPCPQEPIASK